MSLELGWPLSMGVPGERWECQRIEGLKLRGVATKTLHIMYWAMNTVAFLHPGTLWLQPYVQMVTPGRTYTPASAESVPNKCNAMETRLHSQPQCSKSWRDYCERKRRHHLRLSSWELPKSCHRKIGPYLKSLGTGLHVWLLFSSWRQCQGDKSWSVSLYVGIWLKSPDRIRSRDDSGRLRTRPQCSKRQSVRICVALFCFAYAYLICAVSTVNNTKM
jgi:hypothetical protein